MRQTSSPLQPSVSPEVAALHQLQSAMAELASDATANERASAAAKLGHLCWFAEQNGRRFKLIHPGGGLARDPERAFTRDGKKLAAWPGCPTPHTAVFDLVVEGDPRGRFVWDLELQQVAPWRELQEIPPAPSRPQTEATPVQPSQQLLEIGPLCVQQTAVAVAVAAAASRHWKCELDAAVEKRASLVRTLDADKAKLQRLNRALGDQLAADLLAGKTLDDEHHETRQIHRLQNRIGASSAAQDLANGAIDAARVQWESAEQARSEAVVDWSGAEQLAAIESIRQALDIAAPAMARLAAVDEVKSRLLGPNIRTQRPHHPGLVSGGRVVRKIIDHLPTNIRPRSLEETAFASAVTADAAAINPEMELLG